jgi:hypothetical protein
MFWFCFHRRFSPGEDESFATRLAPPPSSQATPSAFKVNAGDSLTKRATQSCDKRFRAPVEKIRFC